MKWSETAEAALQNRRVGCSKKNRLIYLASSQADTDGQFTFKYLIISHSLSISASPFILAHFKVSHISSACVSLSKYFVKTYSNEIIHKLRWRIISRSHTSMKVLKLAICLKFTAAICLLCLLSRVSDTL